MNALRPLWHHEHRFPHKRIKRKVCRALAGYVCEANPAERSDDCAAGIDPGAAYLRVAITPPKNEAGRWITVRLCAPCAVALGLATEEPPE